MSNQGQFGRRRLPHWDLPGAVYFVTTCLAGSIPARELLDLRRYREELQARPRPADVPPRAWAVKAWKQVFARSEGWLDQAPAVRHLEDARLARVVVAALYHHAGVWYDLLGYVVMPSHLHWVFQPRPEWVASLAASADRRTPRERVMHSVKTFTARECNRVLNRTGAFWQQESYDHCVTDEEELGRVLTYVEGNPVKAGLVDAPEAWLFSSAHGRVGRGLHPGQPLPRPPRIPSGVG